MYHSTERRLQVTSIEILECSAVQSVDGCPGPFGSTENRTLFEANLLMEFHRSVRCQGRVLHPGHSSEGPLDTKPAAPRRPQDTVDAGPQVLLLRKTAILQHGEPLDCSADIYPRNHWNLWWSGVPLRGRMSNRGGTKDRHPLLYPRCKEVRLLCGT